MLRNCLFYSLRLSVSAILIVSTAISISACTVFPDNVDTKDRYQVPPELATGDGWWHARFRIAWPEQQKPDWSMGALIAGEIISPVLTEFRNDIEYWRVHRRAVRDGHDHVFTFVFYSSAKTASLIYEHIDNNHGYKQLLSKQYIIWTGFDDTTTILLPEVSATSDSNWPVEIQQTWPSFIMGASQMWLDLVTEYAAQLEDNIEPIERYQKVQNRLTEVWQAEGRHALLHHLNALYAYQPILMHY